MTLTLGKPARLHHRGAAMACVAIGIAALVLASLRVERWVSDPAAPLLLPEAGASWIIADEPFHLSLRKLQHYKTIFRKYVDVTRKLENAPLTVRAFKIAAVFVDGRRVAPPREDFARWKEPIEIQALPYLEPGRHELEVQVVNENGPPALLARCEAIGLRSDASWTTSADGEAWAPARLASAARSPQIVEEFPSSAEALSRSAPLLGAAFLAVAGFTLWRERTRSRPRWLESLPPAPSLARWVLVFAWCLLGANNLQRVPTYIGFDSLQHLDYIRYVAERGTIPLASEGWQMFQSPLYYLVSAPLYLFFSQIFEPEMATKLLRVVPLACGAAQVELSYRAVRRVFSERKDLQVLGTVIGGLLPMNIYLSQGLGNELMAGLLSSATLVATMSLLSSDDVRRPFRDAALIGLLFGLALLTKVTAALLLPAVAGAVAFAVWRARAGQSPVLHAAGALTMLLLVAGLTSGWYYARNWIALGKPFFGGWDPAREIVWWQDPGFRTLSDFTRFGTAVAHPVYAATAGFWDALYSTFWTDGYLSMVISYAWRPPWHYDLMISGAILGLLPSTAIAAGVLSTFARDGRARWKPLWLASACVAIFLAALVCLYAALPVYSTGKATYLSSLTCCFAVLAAAGLELLTRSRALRPVLNGAVAAWAVAAYGAYFIC